MPFITDRQKEVLGCIAGSKFPLSYRDIGDMIDPQVSPQAAYYTVTQLVKKKLLRRDNRARSVRLTQLGREIL